MSLKASNTIIKNNPKETNLQSHSEIDLNETEIVTLLSLIKRSTFNGGDIESLYNLVLKLQYQYTHVKNK